MTRSAPALHLAQAPVEQVADPRAATPVSGVLGLLAAGIPLTLLIDLASPAGPDSRSILEAESVEVTMSRSA